MKSKIEGIVLVLIAAVMWGIMGIFVRELQAVGLSSTDITFLRCALAGVALFIFKGFTDPSCLRVGAKGLVICVMYGTFTYTLGFMGYNISVERIPVAVATVLMFMSPIWVAILERVVFKEKLEKRTIVIIALCIFGACLVANLIATSGDALDPIGIIAGIINGVGVALQLTITKYFQDTLKKDTMIVYGFLGAAVMLSLFTDFGAIGASLASPQTLETIWNMFGIGILCTMIANYTFVVASNYIAPTTCGILSAVEVVVGALVGYLLYMETLSMLQILGAVIVVLSAMSSAILEALDNTKLKHLHKE